MYLITYIKKIIYNYDNKIEISGEYQELIENEELLINRIKEIIKDRMTSKEKNEKSIYHLITDIKKI